MKTITNAEKKTINKMANLYTEILTRVQKGVSFNSIVAQMNEQYGKETATDLLIGFRETLKAKGFMKKQEENNKPEPNKQYALTGTRDDKCIMNGNTWEESEVKEGE